MLESKLLIVNLGFRNWYLVWNVANFLFLYIGTVAFYKIRSAGPCLPGHEGCGFRIPCAFQQSSVMLSTIYYQPSAVNLFTGLRNVVISPQLLSNSGSITPPKIQQFSSLFHGSKNQKNSSEGHRKTTQIDRGIHNKIFLCKVAFCNSNHPTKAWV